jgi:hypothetical protein
MEIQMQENNSDGADGVRPKYSIAENIVKKTPKRA